jgi:hypothetical protein
VVRYKKATWIIMLMRLNLETAAELLGAAVLSAVRFKLPIKVIPVLPGVESLAGLGTHCECELPLPRNVEKPMLPSSLFLAMYSGCPVVAHELFLVFHRHEKWWRSSGFRNQTSVGYSPMPPTNNCMQLTCR